MTFEKKAGLKQFKYMIRIIVGICYLYYHNSRRAKNKWRKTKPTINLDIFKEQLNFYNKTTEQVRILNFTNLIFEDKNNPKLIFKTIKLLTDKKLWFLWVWAFKHRRLLLRQVFPPLPWNAFWRRMTLIQTFLITIDHYPNDNFWKPIFHLFGM